MAQTQATVSEIPVLRDFRLAMRRLASTVTILSTRVGAERHGITATAVVSLSFDPPSLLVCVNRSASVHRPIVQSGYFCVNPLREVHAPIARAFAGTLNVRTRFSAGDWAEGCCGLPYLKDAQANVFCRLDACTAYGTHSIFIGRVLEVRVAEEVMPLVYRDGAYSSAVALEP